MVVDYSIYFIKSQAANISGVFRRKYPHKGIAMMLLVFAPLQGGIQSADPNGDSHWFQT